MRHVILLSHRDCVDGQRVLDLYRSSYNTEDCKWTWTFFDGLEKETEGDFQWKILSEESTHELMKDVEHCGEVDVKDGIDKGLKNTTDRLHHVADILPAMGTLLEVCLWPPSTDSESYIPFVGALRRLKDWHNAKVTIFDRELSPSTELLHRLLASDICISVTDFMPATESLVWRGKVSICDKIENNCILIPGVSVCKTDNSSPDLKFPQRPHHRVAQQSRPRSDSSYRSCLIWVSSVCLWNNKDIHSLDAAQLGRMLEVLDEVTVSAVPAFLKTQHQYKLSFYQKHSYCQILSGYLQENTKTGLLARLAVYPSRKSVLTCADIGLSEDAWKESISADIQFAQEPEEELQDNYEFLYFIITSPRDTITADKFVATMHLLQHPYNLDGSVMSVIYHKALTSGDTSDVKEFDLGGLPILSADMTDKWIAEKNHSGASTQCPVYMNSVPKLSINMNKENTDLLEKTFDWPERLIQQYLESQKRSLSRIQSSESVPLSSPIQPTGASATISIDKFLKFFQPDGSACTNLSPIRRRPPGRSHYRTVIPDNVSPQTIAWPDSKDMASHDVYYNLDKKSEKVNNHLNRLQEKYVKDETYSSCRSGVVMFPNCSVKKQTQSYLDLRRSPRKRAAPSSWSDSREVVKRQKIQSDRQLKMPLATIQEGESRRRLSLPTFTQSQRRGSTGPTKERSELESNRSDDVHCQVEKRRRESDIGVSSSSLGEGTKKESRSERHKRKLLDIVESVLLEQGVDRAEPIFKPCSSRLYKVTKLFVMDLPTSRNLKLEMRKIAESQVKQVIEVDRKRLSSSQRTRHEKKSVS